MDGMGENLLVDEKRDLLAIAQLVHKLRIVMTSHAESVGRRI
jgi:hypothetical protein